MEMNSVLRKKSRRKARYHKYISPPAADRAFPGQKAKAV
jgi:hypothetical protein